MRHPFHSLAAAVLLILAAALPAATPRAEGFSGEPAFNEAAFDAAQKAGKPILIHVTAGWCSVCARQKAILKDLLREPRFKAVMLFSIDFDSQKDLLRRFGARSQSTFIVFRGKTQQAINFGDTRPRSIELMLSKALPSGA